MHVRFHFVLGFFLIAVGVCGNAAAQSTKATSSQKPEATANPAPAAATTDQDYHIGPQGCGSD